MYYRALDYVCEAKETIEKKLYAHLTESGMDNTLILYDITSLYFEGTQAPLAKRGHSRDKRGDLEQIVVGLVLSKDGLPIAHHVFEGNRVDVSTVKEVVADLRKRFGTRRATFVGDRGMVSFQNIEEIKTHQWDYILGLKRRNRTIIDHLLPHVLRNPQKRTQEFRYADLRADMQKNYDKNVGSVVCYNTIVAKEKEH